ncbi:PIH1 domain-containing protein 1 [Mycena sanguinolenta]|uniref:PIH1 domain-containing protein 1 n=1 Tax=Mycena sanguinolenta TaxID=230812 RepID=A0A8H6Z9I4_9AGAR|nr:PIH1 domain-containing protein 1 [Mycena sanguinolenta]
MSNISVSLKPSAGFCIKSTTLKPAALKVASSAVPPGPNSLEPHHSSIAVPVNQKIFVNIAWDAQVPPPPEGNEEAIQRAMHGEDEHLNPDAWFVPVVVSEPRQDKDKAGNSALVFDCIYHSSIKSRTVRDPAFKIFIQELALQRIEAQTSLVLSRQISTPNIASKGKLLPRTVLIPSVIPTAPNKRPLIEEISPSAPIAVSDKKKSDAPVKGILKSNAPPSTATLGVRPTWSWSKSASGSIEITIVIPFLTHALVAETTLDLEPRRVILTVPGHPPLDINLGVSDAEIVAKSGAATPNGGLSLKRERELNVDAATAEWRVSAGVLVVVA